MNTVKVFQFLLLVAPVLMAGPKELWAPPPDNPATRTVMTPHPIIDTNRCHLITTRVKTATQVGMVLMGNSITHYWEWDASYGAFTQGRNVLNMGVSGDVTPGMLHSLLVRDWLGLPSGITPKVVMILAGTNNCHRTDIPGMRGPATPPQEVADGIRAIIQVFARRFPNMRVIQLGIFPTDWHTLWTPVNRITAGYFDTTQVISMNLEKLFLNSDGSVNKGLLPDGIHPNNAGYILWAGAVDSILKKIYAAPPLVPVKIMHIGGSITEGLNSGTSYRRYMDAYIRQEGHLVDFIGSRTKHNNNSTIPSTYYFDYDHEGHWGANSTWFGSNISGLLTANVPDVAVIHMGTEDIVSGTGLDQSIADAAATNLQKIVDALRAKNKKVKIVLAKIIPIKGKTASVNVMNLRISQFIIQNSNAASPIVVADQFTGFNAGTDLDSAGVLPNAVGADKMAKVFSAVLHNLLSGIGCMDRGYLEFDPSASKGDALLCKTVLTTLIKENTLGLSWNSSAANTVKVYTVTGKKIGQASTRFGQITNSELSRELQLKPGIYLIQQGRSQVKKALLVD